MFHEITNRAGGHLFFLYFATYILHLSHFASGYTWPCVPIQIYPPCHLDAAQEPRLIVEMRKASMCGYTIKMEIYRSFEHVCVRRVDMAWRNDMFAYTSWISGTTFYKQHRCPTSAHMLIQHNGSVFISHLVNEPLLFAEVLRN